MAEDRNASIEKLKGMLEDIDFCMLTTMDGGKLRSRPMSTQELGTDGELWFFTRDSTHKMEEIAADSRVNVAYSKPDDNTYVSVSGTASLSRDRTKMEELWSPILKAWFPDGLEDKNMPAKGSGRRGGVLGCVIVKVGPGRRVYQGARHRAGS